MTITTSDKKWFDEFVLELRLRDVRGPAIGDAVASARELLADSGQRADDAFGPARAYAESLELAREEGPGLASRGLWPALLGLIAFLLFTQAASAWFLTEPFLVSPGQVAIFAAIACIIAFLPLYLNVVVRRLWLLILLPVVGGVLGLLANMLSPASPAEAWLVLDPVLWMAIGAIAMVALSVWSTIQSVRRGSADDIIDPLTSAPDARSRGGRAFAILTNWLFPIFTSVLMLVVLITR